MGGNQVLLSCIRQSLYVENSLDAFTQLDCGLYFSQLKIKAEQKGFVCRPKWT